MRKTWLVLSVLALTATFGSMTARAQTAISLNTSTTKGITFTSTTMGNLMMGAALFGTAAGQGGLLGTTGFYSLNTPSPVTLTLGPSFSPFFADYTASGTLNFDITSMNGGGTDLLKGTLSLVDLVQITSSGFTDTSVLTNIILTGGTLESSFPGGGAIGQLTINLAGLGFLPSLSGAISTNLRHGSIEALATPEPWSMLLYGSGLVLIGFVLRRRLAPVGMAARA
jgi:hypothetical protein